MRTIPLTLIWVGFLRVRFEVGGGRGIKRVRTVLGFLVLFSILVR